MSALRGEEALRRIAEEALRQSGADQTEVRIDHSSGSLTRFAANAIHQNVANQDTVVSVRAVFGKRVGAASTNRTDAEGIRRVVEDAQALARLAHEDPEFTSLPAPGAAAPERVALGEGTLRSDPERRAEMAAEVCGAARAAGMQASGSESANT
jgi:predicted Zn-dependent protease